MTTEKVCIVCGRPPFVHTRLLHASSLHRVDCLCGLATPWCTETPERAITFWNMMQDNLKPTGS